jgi:nucleotide-binding universal stress UspA family protein
MGGLRIVPSLGEANQSKETGMYRNVVVGIDGSEGGRNALALAGWLAPAPEQLALVHVRVLEAPALRGYCGPFDAELREDSRRLLKAAQAPSARPAETLSVLAADVGAGLHDAAESRGADLLVVGRCHHSGVGRVLAGDDTRSVLHHASCAVAVAPLSYAGTSRRPAVIGVAYDGSRQSKVALDHARGLAEQTGGKVLARYVIEAGAWGVPVWADRDDQIELVRERLGDLGGAEVTIVLDSVAHALAELGETVDVLVCGSRQNGIVKRIAVGSTSNYLARHSPCPLIVTPAAIERSDATTGHEKSVTVKA